MTEERVIREIRIDKAEEIQIHGWRVSRSLCHLNSNQLDYRYIVFETK